MTRPSLVQAIGEVAAAPGDLSAWAKQEPGSECQPERVLLKNLLRNGWPHRRVTLPHQRAAGHREVEQSVVVVPTAMLRALCSRLGWDFEDAVKCVVE